MLRRTEKGECQTNIPDKVRALACASKTTHLPESRELVSNSKRQYDSLCASCCRREGKVGRSARELGLFLQDIFRLPSSV
jgi:hypothetical protein